MGCCLLKSDTASFGVRSNRIEENTKLQGCYTAIKDIFSRYSLGHAPSLGSTISDSEREICICSDGDSVISNSSFDDGETTRQDNANFGMNGSFVDKKQRLPHGFSQFYEMKEMIGVGTTSKCYRCIRRGRGFELACKVIDKRRLAADKRRRQIIVEQLRQEVAVLRKLDHPNIVKLEDVIETPHHLFIVMEYMRGGELFDAIIDRGAFSENEARKIVQMIVSALDYMHSNGIVHRDVKPENLLLVSKDLHTLELKLIDFGFSKILNYNMTASFLGTGGYLAPEIRQQKFYSSSVDVWALGVMVYLLLSGRLPFQAATEILPSHQPVHNLYTLTFPDEQWSSVSSEAKDLIRCLLETDPVRRYTTQQVLRHPWLIKLDHSDSVDSTGNHKKNGSKLRTVQSLLNIEATAISQTTLRKTPSVVEWRLKSD